MRYENPQILASYTSNNASYTHIKTVVAMLPFLRRSYENFQFLKFRKNFGFVFYFSEFSLSANFTAKLPAKFSGKFHHFCSLIKNTTIFTYYDFNPSALNELGYFELFIWCPVTANDVEMNLVEMKNEVIYDDNCVCDNILV